MHIRYKDKRININKVPLNNNPIVSAGLSGNASNIVFSDFGFVNLSFDLFSSVVFGEEEFSFDNKERNKKILEINF